MTLRPEYNGVERDIIRITWHTSVHLTRLPPHPSPPHLTSLLWALKLPSAHHLITGFVQFTAQLCEETLLGPCMGKWGTCCHPAPTSPIPHSPPTPPTPHGASTSDPGIHRENLVPMSHCCPCSAIAAAPMGEKIKDMFQSNPLAHPPNTHTHARAHTHTRSYSTSTPKALPLHPRPSSPSPKRYQRHLNRDFDERNRFLKAILSKVPIKKILG